MLVGKRTIMAAGIACFVMGCGSTDVVPPPEGTGVVVVSDLGLSTALTGAFAKGGNVCSQSTIGPCTVTDCTKASPATPISAGTITVSGPMLTIEATPGKGDDHYEATATTGGWSMASGAIMLIAKGADVPAYSATLIAPGAIMVEAPVISPPPAITKI